MNTKQFNEYRVQYDMELKITHPTIVKFYQRHPHIDCENVNLSMINIFNLFLNEDQQAKDDTIIEKMFSKLSALEMFIQSKEPQGNNIGNVVNNLINDTKKSVIDDIVNVSKEMIHNSKNQNMEHILQPLVGNVTQNMENKFQILQNQIILPLTNKINESESRMNNKLDNIHKMAYDNSNTTDSLNKDLGEYLHRIKNSSFKGQYGENKLKMILNSLYPQSNLDENGLTQTSHTKKSGDFILNRGDQVPKILIENKEYDSKKVPDDEVRKFIRDVEEQQCHGIMLSQHNEISCKSNYHIEIHKNFILLYINNVHYDSNKIHLAINTIDFLHQKLLPYLQNDDENKNKKFIDNTILDKINDQFQIFIKNKEALCTLIKDNHKKVMEQIQTIELPGLVDLLSSHYANATETICVCKFCNKTFKGRFPKKALAKHEPSCKLNPINIKTNTEQIQ